MPKDAVDLGWTTACVMLDVLDAILMFGASICPTVVVGRLEPWAPWVLILDCTKA